MRETLKDLKERRSCRKYLDKQVPEDVLNEILEAGTYAPTGIGKQSPFIVVLQDKEKIDEVLKLRSTGRPGNPFYDAPTVLIVFADSNVMTYMHDGALVMGNLLNAAHAVGVDSCYIFGAKEEFETEAGKELMKKWGLPESCVGIGHCILGYRAEGGVREAAPRKENYIIRG